MPPKTLPANLPSSAACPPSLKAIAPFLQRAAEVKTADPVVAYWCLYNAARLGLPLTKGNDPEAKRYIEQILLYLEASKGALQGDQAISDTDVACERIEAFASRIFGSADNEDRTGAATKLTAKKFLAAANFMQLLSIFDREGDMADKIKYAKWKASDIAKALREGRVPLAGPAGGETSPMSEDPFAGSSPFPDTTALPHPDTQPGAFASGTYSPPRAGTIPHTPSAWSTVATPGPDYTDERKREASKWPQESPTPTPGLSLRPGSMMDDSSAGNAGDDEGGESDAGYWSTASTPGTAFVDGRHLFAAQQQRPQPPPPPAQPSHGSNASGSSGSSSARPTDPSVRRVRFTESTAGGSDDLNEPAPISPIHELQEIHPDESDLRTPTVTNGNAPRQLSQDQAPRPNIVFPPGRGPMEGLPSAIDDEPGPPLADLTPRRSSNSPPRNGSAPLRPSVTTSGHTPTGSIDTPSSSRDSSRVLPPTVPITDRGRRPSQERQERGPPTIDTNLHNRSRSGSGSTPAGPPSGLTPSRKDNGGPPTIQPQSKERKNSLTNGRTPITPDNGPPTATLTGTRDRRNSLTRRDGPPTVILPTAGREQRGSGSGETPDRSFLAPPSATAPRPSLSPYSSPSRSAQVPLPDSTTSSANVSPDLGHHVKPLPGYPAPSKQTPVTPSAPAWNTPTLARPSAPPAPAPSPPAPPPPKEVSFKAMGDAKKHANFAISALNFEDVVTARKELLVALSYLGG
ncbi:DUF605-domain-containing protein [Calocera viscosa TUFC12733]|uniref:DUF605-domain-containing protein n=1 Tax=Calocera viscosa (strain TUFC12733) TaxID=1330018 RepID=A0A167RKE6_CALVF|nr:DUF605-domain-containing protein [Calocera viscosa TUFC12733]